MILLIEIKKKITCKKKLENIYKNNIEIPNKNTYDKENKKEINKTDGK